MTHKIIAHPAIDPGSKRQKTDDSFLSFSVPPLFKQLPIGAQNFEDIIQNQGLYIDKTGHIHTLVSSPIENKYFLARPRRFGKTLLATTLEAVFQGKKDLFDGLAISKSGYKFEPFPVIRLNMANTVHTSSSALHKSIAKQLRRIGTDSGIDIDIKQPVQGIFEDLMRGIYTKCQRQAVLLIDEYDSPILSQLHNPALANQHIETLRDFYRVTKTMDDEKKVRFTFVTGITNCAKGNLFSGLNHLENITDCFEYAAIAGLTETEIYASFQDRLSHMGQRDGFSEGGIKQGLKYWYNGYRFTTSETTVYNPMSVLSFFKQNTHNPILEYKNFWFETGTPTMLVQALKTSQDVKPQDFDSIQTTREGFSHINMENIQGAIIPLMYQTGYLTIKTIDTTGARPSYQLGFPNEEVRISLFSVLLSSYTNNHMSTTSVTVGLEKALKSQNIDGFMQRMQDLFRLVPYTICPYKEIPQREAYYQSIFYTALTVLGFNIQVELTTNIGRLDAAISTNDSVFVIEFKLNKSAAEAMAQIQTHDYCQAIAANPLHAQKDIFAIGANFSTESRNIEEGWLVTRFDRETRGFSDYALTDSISK